MIFLVVLLEKKPHMKISLNFLEIFSELIFFVLHSVISCIAIDDIVGKFEENVRYTLGWIMIVSCTLLIFVYLGFLLSEYITVVKEFAKKLVVAKMR